MRTAMEIRSFILVFARCVSAQLRDLDTCRKNLYQKKDCFASQLTCTNLVIVNNTINSMIGKGLQEITLHIFACCMFSH